MNTTFTIKNLCAVSGMSLMVSIWHRSFRCTGNVGGSF